MRFETALVVDDEAGSRAVLRHVLELSGIRVTEAPGPRMGLARARAELPDLVVTDIRMPEASGIELATRIRSDPRLADAAIVAVTHHPADADRAEAGVFDLVLRKPISVAHLRAWLRAAD